MMEMGRGREKSRERRKEEEKVRWGREKKACARKIFYCTCARKSLHAKEFFHCARETKKEERRKSSPHTRVQERRETGERVGKMNNLLLLPLT